MPLTPEQAAQRYEKLREALRRWGERILKQWSVRVGATASTRYMRDAKGEPVRRDPADGGPLRKVSTRLSASLIGARYKGRQEGINRVSVSSRRRVTLTKGSRVPYARVHEEGFSGMRSDGVSMNIPARPYLRPAIRDEMPTLRRMAQETLAEEIDKFLSEINEL